MRMSDLNNAGCMIESIHLMSMGLISQKCKITNATTLAINDNSDSQLCAPNAMPEADDRGPYVFSKVVHHSEEIPRMIIPVRWQAQFWFLLVRLTMLKLTLIAIDLLIQ